MGEEAKFNNDHSRLGKGLYYENKKIQSKKVAEFKYKMLLDILPCGQKVNRWNKNVLCAYGNVVENIYHMLYKFVGVKSL